MPPNLERLRPVAQRAAFALLTSVIVVTFSEKMYWYVTGYEVVVLWLAYFLPVFAFLTVVDFFQVQRPAQLFLAAAVFGFLVEGMLAPVLYEGGPFGWFSIAYTPLAWHAPLSIIFGWFLLRRWLVNRQRGRLALGCLAVGLFWGVWSLAWWLPENANDPALLAQGARLGQWPVWEFGLHAFVFTGLVALAHWLLGQGGWQRRFQPTWVELLLVGLLLAGFFSATVLPIYGPWTTLKLGFVLAAALLPLWLARESLPAGSYLGSLADGGELGSGEGREKESRVTGVLAEERDGEGREKESRVTGGAVRPVDALLILLMPAAAVAVYAVAAWLQPPEDLLYIITTWGPVLGTAYLGMGAFIIAIVLTLRLRR